MAGRWLVFTWPAAWIRIQKRSGLVDVVEKPLTQLPELQA
jgi:hypothetical protein